MTLRRPWVEIPVYLLLALVCAFCSNSLAGPTRRLSWIQKEPAGSVEVRRPTIPPPSPFPLQTPSSEKAVLPPVVKKNNAPSSAAMPMPKDEVISRFPPLVDAAQADISGEDAAWLHGRGVLFVDARRTSVYIEGHIPGAKDFPAWEDGLAEKVDQLALFTADLKAPVVIYCSGGDCHDSHLVAEKLWQAGFRNLRIYTGGFPDWEARRLAVVKGEKP